MSASNLSRILSLEVPIVVQLGRRLMTLGEVVAWIPGAIIELPKSSSEELELLVNNKVIGIGVAVKVGENFGLRVSHIGDTKSRIAAMGSSPAADQGSRDSASSSASDDEIAELAAQMLAGQT